MRDQEIVDIVKRFRRENWKTSMDCKKIADKIAPKQ